MTQPTLSIVFGALARPLHEQLMEAGVVKVPDMINAYQEMADAVVRLLIHGLLTDGEAHKARKRLMKKIAASVRGKA